jgi:hypothetical protein
MKKLLEILLETRVEHILASHRGSTLLTALADLAGVIGNNPIHTALLIILVIAGVIQILSSRQSNNRPTQRKAQVQPDALEAKILAKQLFFQAARRRRNQRKA